MSDITDVHYTNAEQGETYLSPQDHQHDYRDITDNPKFWNVEVYSVAETTYDMKSVDCRGKALETTNDSPVTVTIDPTQFTVGDAGEIRQIGAGQVTVVASGGGTLQSLGNLSSTIGQFAIIGWDIRAGNVVYLRGNLG